MDGYILEWVYTCPEFIIKERSGIKRGDKGFFIF